MRTHIQTAHKYKVVVNNTKLLMMSPIQYGVAKRAV